MSLNLPAWLSQDQLETLAYSAFWDRNVVGEWYLRPKQKTVLSFLRETEDPFFEASRRFGKTTTILSHIVEESKKAQKITRWCEPWKNQCREIVMPEMDQIQSHVPQDLRFEYNKTDSVYTNPKNGSKIYLRGVNEDRGESARGTKADFIVADEFGTWKEPDYIVNEVLRPQLLTTKGKLIYTGTPPRDLTHEFYAVKDKAVLENRFIQRLIHDNEGLTKEEIERFVNSLGGWNSPAVRRELLCEKIIDPSFALIPEWDEKFEQEFEVDEYFQFYHKYDSLDVGVRDLSVCELAHYDFRQGKLFLHDEVVMNGPEMTTERLANKIRDKEKERFGDFPVYKRVSDIDLLLINDLRALHGLYFSPTDKGELEQMINEVRIWVNAGRIIIHPRCKQAIGCMRYGLWDDQRRKFERSSSFGHFDALASIMYLVRNVDQRTNPIPFDYGLPKQDYWLTEQKNLKRDKLKKAFGVK